MKRGNVICGIKSRSSSGFLSSSVSPCSSVLVPDHFVPQGKIYGQRREIIDQEERRSIEYIVGLLNS